MEDTSQQVDSGSAAWKYCVTVNIIWKKLHSRWTVVLHLDWSVLHWTIYGRYFTEVHSGIAAWMGCVTVNIIWKIIHSRRTVVLQLEWSALQWIIYGRYFIAGGQWYCSLNGVRYSEHYMEDNSQQVESGIFFWIEWVAVYIIWKIFHRRWTVVFQLEWSALQWTLYGRYFTAGGPWYCSLNGVRYSEHYFEIF